MNSLREKKKNQNADPTTNELFMMEEGGMQKQWQKIPQITINSAAAGDNQLTHPSTGTGGAFATIGKHRLASLDVFRGLTVALMILVDYAGGNFPAINHSPWNGLTLADFVVPFFLFIVGMSVGITQKKPTSKSVATRKTALRALKLFVLGIVLQGGYLHGLGDLKYGVDIDKIRWMGILQRIALAYLLAALCEIWLKGDDDVHSGSSLLRKYRHQ